jgi:hypothetical protein
MEIQGAAEVFFLANFPKKNLISSTTEERDWMMNRTCSIWMYRRDI